MENGVIKMNERLEENIGKYRDEVLRYSDALADAPEVSAEEFEASRLAAGLLARHGFEVEYPFAGLPTAFRGVRKGSGDGPKVALLVEYDALCGLGHACGHCASGAMSLLAGVALGDMAEDWPGELHVIGTPDEEVGGGKIVMAEQGVFDDYDFAQMIHLTAVRTEIWPDFMVLSNLFMEFSGAEAHAAAAPWEGRNALNGVMLTMHAIDMMRQHVLPDVRIHGVIRDGGDAPNIVPGRASVDYYIRGIGRRQAEDVEARVAAAAKGCAMATQTEVEVSHPTATLWDLKPNASAKKLMERAFAAAGVAESGANETPFRGSSDAGNLSLRCPTAHPMLAVMDEPIALHTKEFAARMKSESVHEGIVKGARIIGMAALEVFASPELVRAMREDFKKS